MKKREGTSPVSFPKKNGVRLGSLLAKEKELTAMKDRLSAERRALPWVRVEKDYVFDSPTGAVTLSGCSRDAASSLSSIS